MILENTLARNLAEAFAQGRGPLWCTLTDSHSQATIQLELQENDRLGCRLREIRIARNRTGTDLAQEAERLAKRVTGLLEKLKIHEIDQGLGIAVLRSDTPAVQGDSRSYFELTLSSDRVTLKRWRSSCAISGRTPSDFTITHEALTKLLNDLIC
jgi:hypothetical protein